MAQACCLILSTENTYIKLIRRLKLIASKVLTDFRYCVRCPSCELFRPLSCVVPQTWDQVLVSTRVGTCYSLRTMALRHAAVTWCVGRTCIVLVCKRCTAWRQCVRLVSGVLRNPIITLSHVELPLSRMEQLYTQKVRYLVRIEDDTAYPH